ncbi:General substrate transporter [Penicillium roqueforti FM164]|uniref:General substrate transporter n=2 Tax=Penicillium roqueforti TaxID=5082 RepID=W6QJ57_PENRF|nr:General substrate transporter [Penicillium roqueforti FM164]
MFKMGPQRSLHRVILAAIPQMFLQMSGINVIAQYTPVVFEQFLGFDAFDSGVLAAASQFAVILGAICCSWTVDRVGRRKLMLISATMMSICFACLSGLLAHPENRTGIKAAAFFIYFYLFVYVLGFLGIPFLYASEVAVTQFRAPTTGLSTAVSWLFNFIVAEVTPVGFANIGWKYFLVYCCINALCVPTIYFFFPETAGRSLEEIDEIFLASNSILDTVNVAKGLPKHEHRELYAEEEGKESSSQVAHIDDMGRRDEVA